VFTTKLVAKPDQLIKRRGKAGLLALNKTWEEAKPWIAERAGKPQKVCVCPFALLLSFDHVVSCVNTIAILRYTIPHISFSRIGGIHLCYL
jgi:succinyl-CoA synthetase beta subunit